MLWTWEFWQSTWCTQRNCVWWSWWESGQSVYKVLKECGSHVPNCETIWIYPTQFWIVLWCRKAREEWHLCGTMWCIDFSLGEISCPFSKSYEAIVLIFEIMNQLCTQIWNIKSILWLWPKSHMPERGECTRKWNQSLGRYSLMKMALLKLKTHACPP